MRGLALVLALAPVTGPALAGPYSTVHIRDALFGIGEDRVFLLRRANDNYASYFTEIHSTALIEVDRATGTETIWPVSRTRLDFSISDAFAAPEITWLELPGAVDPFAKLAEHGTKPLLGATGALPVERPQISTRVGYGLLLSWPGTPQAPDERAAFSAILDLQGYLVARDASLTAFLKAMDYERNDVRRFADLDDLVKLAGANCLSLHIWAITELPIALAQSQCSEEDGSSFTMIRVQPGWEGRSARIP